MKPSYLRQIALVGLVSFVSMPVFGQSLVTLHVEIPEMMVRICPTLEDAKKEANLALKVGNEPYVDGTLDLLRNNKCLLVHTSITPLREEQGIKPFATWLIAYDEGGLDEIDAMTLRPPVKIRISVKRDKVRYYFGNLVTRDGTRGSGWVEIPDRPYILDYLENQRKKVK